MSNDLRKINNDGGLLKHKEEFEAVYSIIATHRKRVVRVVNNRIVPIEMAQMPNILQVSQ